MGQSLQSSPNFGIMTTDTERNQMVSKASAMINYAWTPTSDLAGWKGQYTFNADTSYSGIPYSQTAYQKDEIGFDAAMSGTDFYDNYTRFGWVMPKYGSDCSGLVSYAWSISRKTTYDFRTGISNGTYPKVGSYDVNNLTSTDLKNSYALLQKGDAVVNNGHMFMIGGQSSSSSSEFVYVYEQTPPKARFTIWSYDQMANGNYMPFKKNNN